MCDQVAFATKDKESEADGALRGQAASAVVKKRNTRPLISLRVRHQVKVDGISAILTSV